MWQQAILIYLLGYFIAFWICFRSELNHSDTVRLHGLLFNMLTSCGSWITVLIVSVLFIRFLLDDRDLMDIKVDMTVSELITLIRKKQGWDK